MRRHATLADARGHHRILLLVAVVLLLAASSDGIRSPPYDVATPVHGAQDEKISATATLAISPQQATTAGDNVGRGVLQEEVHATGSSLPDCSHACGACSPCSRVMVSFKCSIAEPCPMVYRCMCKGKCYPVPSS